MKLEESEETVSCALLSFSAAYTNDALNPEAQSTTRFSSLPLAVLLCCQFSRSRRLFKIIPVPLLAIISASLLIGN
jgi:MFS superfamily sulfate permease-like transporter